MVNHPSPNQWRRELDLLSRTGAGLPAIAPALAARIRQLVGAQTCVIVWVDPTGMPTGVHHEHPNEATQALFMNEYERLFNGHHETNVSWLVRQRGQHIELQGAMQKTPRFVQDLCLRLMACEKTSVQSSVEVPGGVLRCCARWMGAQAAQVPPEPRRILVTPQREQAQAAQVVREISRLALSPLQSRIALYAAAGGRRDACAGEHQVSDEALKKHLRRIYAASGAKEWSELQACLHSSALAAT